MFIKELADYIATQLTKTIGDDLFVGFLDEGQEGVVIVDAPSSENQSNMESSGFSIQAYYRDYITANDKCREVYDLLAFNNGLQLATVYVFNISGTKTPGFVVRLETGLVLVTATVVAYKERE